MNELSTSKRLLSACALMAMAFAATAGDALKFDAELKEYDTKPGEQSAPFSFVATNTSAAPVTIERLQTSCGCTVAQLPNSPYVLGAGSNVAISANMNLAGKSGSVTKQVIVISSDGVKTLQVKANIK